VLLVKALGKWACPHSGTGVKGTPVCAARWDTTFHAGLLVNLQTPRKQCAALE